MSEPSESGNQATPLRRITSHAYRLFKEVFFDSRPRIALSKNLYFRILSDKAVLVSLGIDNIINIDLPLGDLRSVLGSIHSASASQQVQRICIGRLTVETDGRPQTPRILTDESLLEWFWKPNAVASSIKKSSDYVWIDVTHFMERIRQPIERKNIERAYVELAKLGLEEQTQPS